MFFCQPILCLFRSMALSILHEKGATTTQLSTMKYRQQLLVQNVDIFLVLTFPSQTTSSECPAVQMAPQSITEKSPNLTTGYRRRKENKENSWGWNPPHPDSTAVRKLCKPGLIREDNGIPKLQRLACHL